MKIAAITLKDFQGVKDLTITPNCADVIIKGRNESGKSSILNAFLWLWTGKSHTGKELDPKPVNVETGERILGTAPYVQLDIVTKDGGKRSFEKTMKEKYSGRKTKEYIGDTNDYQIDGVKCRKKDFEEEVSLLIGNLKTFRILVDPNYFLATIKWEERRAILGSVVGNISEEDYITDADKEILDGRTIANAKSFIKASIKKQKDRMDTIPKLIEENNTKIIAPARKRVEAEQELHETRALKETLVNTTDPKAQALADIDAVIREMREKAKGEHWKVKEKSLDAIGDAKSKLSKHGLNDDRDLNRELERLQKDIEEAGTDYKKTRSQKFTLDKCPTCSQQYPEFMAEEMESKFNTNKATELKNIGEHGKKLEKLITECKKLIGLQESNKEQFNKLTLELTELRIEQENLAPYTDTPEILEKYAERTKILNTADSSDTGRLEKLVTLRDTEDALLSEILTFQNNENFTNRITELTIELEDCSDKKAELEQRKNAVEEIEGRVFSSVEESVNKEFQIIKWRLFDHQKDGEIISCCEALVDGVGYNGGSLNFGNRINAMADIFNIFCAKLEAEFPYFVDNAECITNWKVTPIGQTIKMYAEDCDLEVIL